MVSLLGPSITLEQYLEAEFASDVKHEYYQGRMYAMADVTFRHGQITARVTAKLVESARRLGCTALSNCVRVRVGRDSFYPDMSVICGQPIAAPDDKDAITNPTLIVEVLSESTEGFDRGRKGISYRTLPSLREYVLVSQSGPLIERYTRNDDGTWQYAQAVGLDASIRLVSVDATVALAEVYVGVTFDPAHGEQQAAYITNDRPAENWLIFRLPLTGKKSPNGLPCMNCR